MRSAAAVILAGASVLSGGLVAGCAGPAAPIATDQVPAAFVALVTAPDRTMHMTWDATYAMGERDAATTPSSATFDFAGNDYAGSITTLMDFGPKDESGQSIVIEIALVGGQAYQRSPMSGSGNWERTTALPSSPDPLRQLTLADLAYVAQETVQDASLHHLRVADVATLMRTLSQGAGLPLPQEGVHFDDDSSSFDIWVDTAGRPVSAKLELATGPDLTEFGTISLSSTYEFSAWGAEIYIVAPP